MDLLTRRTAFKAALGTALLAFIRSAKARALDLTAPITGIPSNIHLMRWRPPCGCQMIEWHDQILDTWGVHKLEKKCASHKAVADKDLFDTILDRS